MALHLTPWPRTSLGRPAPGGVPSAFARLPLASRALVPTISSSGPRVRPTTRESVAAPLLPPQVVFIQTIPIDLKSLTVLPNSAAPLKICANTDEAAMSTPSSGFSSMAPGGGGLTEDDMCA